MNLFEEIVRESFLLNEDASVSDVNSAIDGLHPVWILYDDEQGGRKGKRRRLIYPVAYGLSMAGNPVIRAFQPQGSTKRGIPKWKLFRMDRVTYWRTISSKRFNPKNLIGFNEDGDKSMDKLFNIAPIGAAKALERDNNNYPIITPDPVTKAEVDTPNKANQEKIQDRNNVSANDIVNNTISYLKSKAQNPEDKNITNQEKNIDNSGNNQYNKINAPATTPVTKAEIDGNNPQLTGNNGEGQENNNNIDKMNANGQPVTKAEIENDPQNDITPKFNDMMSRMNNLNKEEEEEVK